MIKRVVIAMNGGEFLPKGYLFSDEFWDDLKDSLKSGMIASLFSIPYNYLAVLKSYGFLPLQMLANAVCNFLNKQSKFLFVYFTLKTR